MATDADLPEFGFDKSKYDESTWWGRSRYFYEATSPFTLLTSESTLKSSLSILQKFRDGAISSDPELSKLPKNVINRMLWDARSVSDSIIHPDTQKPTNPFFRFSAFVPVNLLIMPFMLHPSTLASPIKTASVHVFNQTYNAAVNYENRNASNQVDDVKVLQGFIGAVVTSVGIGLGATAVTNRAHRMPKVLGTGLRIFLPFVAVAFAGTFNLCLVRRDELFDGITVYDKDDNEVGKSPFAARNALLKCSAARFAWCTPIILFPPIIALQAEKIWPALKMKNNPRLNIAFMTALFGIHLFGVVPPCLGLFPQYDSMPVESLEPEYQGLLDGKGNRIDVLYFNKGL